MMLTRLFQGPLRFLIYLVVIAVIVPIALYFVSDLNRPELPKTAGNASPLAVPPAWKLTDAAIAEAQEGFVVENIVAGNTSIAWTSTEGNWPQFNGEKRNNCSEELNLLAEWPADGPPLLWLTRGMGAGYSSVAVQDGVVYCLGNKGSSEAMIALDVGTGEKLWSTPFARASQGSMGPGPRGTPAYSDGAVYGMGGEGVLACFDARTGAIRWQKNIQAIYGAQNLGWGTCESVLIDGDRLICAPGTSKATIVALNKKSGEEIWKSTLSGERASYASAAVAEIDGVRQYVHFLGTSTLGVRASDGELLWQDSHSANGTANCSSPLINGKFVFSASNYGQGGALLRLTSKGKKTSAEFVYHTQDMKSHHGDLVIVNNLIFGSNDPGVLVCLELETGKMKWQNRSVGKGAVTYADGKIYLRGEANEIALIEATGEAYRELGRFTQPNRSSSSAWSHPVVAHGRLFLRDQDALLCYDVRQK